MPSYIVKLKYRTSREEKPTKLVTFNYGSAKSSPVKAKSSPARPESVEDILTEDLLVDKGSQENDDEVVDQLLSSLLKESNEEYNYDSKELPQEEADALLKEALAHEADRHDNHDEQDEQEEQDEDAYAQTTHEIVEEASQESQEPEPQPSKKEPEQPTTTEHESRLLPLLAQPTKPRRGRPPNSSRTPTPTPKRKGRPPKNRTIEDPVKPKMIKPAPEALALMQGYPEKYGKNEPATLFTENIDEQWLVDASTIRERLAWLRDKYAAIHSLS